MRKILIVLATLALSNASYGQAKNIKLQITGNVLVAHFDVDAKLLPNCIEGSGGVFIDPNQTANEIVFECTVPLVKIAALKDSKSGLSAGKIVMSSNRNINNTQPAPYVIQQVEVIAGERFETISELNNRDNPKFKVHDPLTLYLFVRLSCHRTLSKDCGNQSLLSRATRILNKKTGAIRVQFDYPFGSPAPDYTGGSNTNTSTSTPTNYGSGTSKFCNQGHCVTVLVNPVGSPGPAGYSTESYCYGYGCQDRLVYRGPTVAASGGGYGEARFENRPVIAPDIESGCGGYTCP